MNKSMYFHRNFHRLFNSAKIVKRLNQMRRTSCSDAGIRGGGPVPLPLQRGEVRLSPPITTGNSNFFHPPASLVTVTI